MSRHTHMLVNRNVLAERIPDEHLAACKSTGAATFHTPEVAVIRQAIAICNTCPIRPACLAYAHRLHPASAVWGGVWFGSYGRPDKPPAGTT